MIHLILVHGAWHASWIWDEIKESLQPYANVIAIDLPGRIPSASPEYLALGLHAYVKVLEACIAKLHGPIVLVGHSLAGFSISQVAEYLPHKISKLIYLAGFLPRNNTNLLVMSENLDENGLANELVYAPRANQVQLKKNLRTQNILFNRCDAMTAHKALQKLQPEPWKAFTENVQLTRSLFGKVPKIYIKCNFDQVIPLSAQEAMLKSWELENVFSLATDHSPFLSDPEALQCILQQQLQNI